MEIRCHLGRIGLNVMSNVRKLGIGLFVRCLSSVEYFAETEIVFARRVGYLL